MASGWARARARARAQHVPVVVVQHIADSAACISPFLNAGTVGAEIHPRNQAAAPDAIVVTNTLADSFVDTTLEATLSRLGVEELLICGMMTQNCVTHAAISKSAEKYPVAILTDWCTTVTEMLHLIALHAVSTRVQLAESSTVL